MPLYEFDRFTFDSVQRLLYREGELVPMTPKTMDLLNVLLENAGEVVSKEQISSAVWEDVFIDESNITKNISLLRKTLRSTSESDDPIRTIPKRGYQFVLAVTMASSAGAAGSRIAPDLHSAASLGAMQAGAPQAEVQTGQASSPLLSGGGRRWLLLLTGVLAVLVGAVSLFFSHHQRPVESRRPVLAVLPFANLSGSPDAAWVSTALRETLVSELDAGERFRTIPDDAVEQMTRDLSFRPAATLSKGTLEGIRSNLGCSYVVSGTYLQVGDSLRVDAYLQDVDTGKVLARTSQTRPAGELIGTITQVGDQLRSALRESPLLGDQRQEIAASVPAEPAALQLYAEGLQRLRVLDAPGALSSFTRLAALDPTYSLAHSALSQTYELMGNDAAAAAEAKLAFDNSSRLSREERLLVEANYGRATRHWPEAIAAQQTLWRTFPDNNDYGVRLAQTELLGGKPQDALATIARLEDTSGRSDPRAFVAEASIRYQTGDFRAMLIAARQAQKLAKGQGAQTLYGRARTQEGDALMHIGSVTQAREAFGEAQSIAQKYGDKVGLMQALRRDGGAVGTVNPRASIPLFEQDCAIAEGIGDAREAINCQIALGFAYQRLGQFQQAGAAFNSALPRSKAIRDTRLVLVCLEALGFSQVRLALWQQANDTLDEAEALAGAKSSSYMQHMITGDRSMLLALRGDLGPARVLAERAVSMARNGKDPLGVARELEQLAFVLSAQRNLAEAATALQEVCALAEKGGQWVLLAKCRIGAADIALQRGDRKLAQSLLEGTQYDHSTIAPGFAAACLRTNLALADRDFPAAQMAADLAARIAVSATSDVIVKLDSALLQANLEAATGHHAHAIASFKSVYAQAKAAGLRSEQEKAHAGLVGHAETAKEERPLATA